jgi:hypothetical protein
MTAPEQAQREIRDALYDHFDRSGQALDPEEISEMTALDLPTVTNALRVLHKAGFIEGVTAAEFDYPLKVTGIVYHR